VDEFSRVHILEGLKELVDDELLVNFLKDACAYDDVQIWNRLEKYLSPCNRILNIDPCYFQLLLC
jgi:hypothetical protein